MRDWTCNWDGEDKKCLRDFGNENIFERTHLEDRKGNKLLGYEVD